MKLMMFFLTLSTVSFAYAQKPIMICKSLENPPQDQVQVFSTSHAGLVEVFVMTRNGTEEKFLAQYQEPGTTAICNESPCYGGNNFTLMWAPSSDPKKIEGSLSALGVAPIYYEPVLCGVGM